VSVFVNRKNFRRLIVFIFIRKANDLSLTEKVSYCGKIIIIEILIYATSYDYSYVSILDLLYFYFITLSS
jgi:hypothetical protein